MGTQRAQEVPERARDRIAPGDRVRCLGGFEMPLVPECLACGACCFSRLETYVPVTGDDHERLGERVDELVRFEGNRAYMRMVDGHCAALRIEPGSSQLVCSAYATRPQTCRDLARDSGACRGEIAGKQDRPPRALALALALSRPGHLVMVPR
jgi:hypothetical protein